MDLGDRFKTRPWSATAVLLQPKTSLQTDLKTKNGQPVHAERKNEKIMQNETRVSRIPFTEKLALTIFSA